MIKQLMIISFILVGVIGAKPVLAEDTGTCTCTYTIASVSSGKTSSEKTYEVNHYNGQTASSEPTCQLICSDWVDGRTAANFGKLIYKLSSASYVGASSTTAASTTENRSTTPIDYFIPELSVDIPGISFSKPLDEGEYLRVDFLPVYIAGVYRTSLGIAAIIAIVMIMIAGTQYILSGADAEMVGAAKTRISNASVGLVIILSSYVLLITVNPKLTSFASLQLFKVPESEFLLPPFGEDDNTKPRTDIPNGTSTLSHRDSNGVQTIGGAAGVFVNKTMLNNLYAAADASYAATNTPVFVTSGYRTPTNQLKNLWRKCIRNAGGACDVPVCNPIPISAGIVEKTAKGFKLSSLLASLSEDAFLAKALPYVDPSLCPHTSSVAIDAWCAGSGSDFQFNTACQSTFIKMMEQNGFCRLKSEPWHFEYDAYKVSNACSTTQDPNTYTRGGTLYDYSGCKTWDAKNNVCLSNN